MVKGESPRIIFDLIMTRFEDEYNPTIIYDASCRAKEMGLNREPERFLKIKFVSDPLHVENHTTYLSINNTSYNEETQQGL